MPKYWIAIGDIHGATAVAVRIPGIREAEGIIVTGDMTNYGGPGEVAEVIARLRELNPNVLAQIGNMDMPEADTWLSGEGINMHRSVRELAPGVWLLGVGYSAITPFGTPSEVPDAQLGRWLNETHARLPAHETLVLVSHTPPKETATDVVGGGVHVGSEAVREFLERIEPALCLTGHIHEAAAEDHVGRTKIVNPGMLSAGGYILLTVTDDGGVDAQLRRVEP